MGLQDVIRRLIVQKILFLCGLRHTSCSVGDCLQALRCAWLGNGSRVLQEVWGNIMGCNERDILIQIAVYQKGSAPTESCQK